MSPEEKEIRQKLKDDFIHYAAKCLKIRTKEGSIEPFLLNKAQQYIHERIEKQKKDTGKVRAIILKGRQQGCSTLIGGRFYHRVTHSKGIQAFILTHALDATNNLFKLAQRYHENCPVLVKPDVSTNNSKELVFGLLESGYKLGTAENKSVGRSATIQLFHGSECGFWANAAEHSKGILQAVPDSMGTEIIIESTANGVGNYFHQQWQLAEAGISDFIPIFVPWFWQIEYQREPEKGFSLNEEEIKLQKLYGLSLSQLSWRRHKIIGLSVNGANGFKSFKQEYPCNANEAFQLTGEDTFIQSDLVMKCRKSIVEPYGPLVIGCDPARFGDDRTSIIRRQGRVASKLESYTKKNTMEVVGLLHTIIEAEDPKFVFVDIGGLGAGIVDRLHEMGHRKIVIGVNAGSEPLNKKKYDNKRAEMWGLCREWMENEPCQVPDSDSLHADLCGAQAEWNSNSQLVIESKKKMKKRGIRSPDEAECLIQTFAYPATSLSDDNSHNSRTASKIMSSQKKTMKLKERLYGGGG